MATFKVKGGVKLKGDLHPQGAKNEALQVLCAVLLTPDEVIMENVPNIRDVNILIDLLRDLNVNVEQINEQTYRFQANNIDINYLSSEEYKNKSSKIRGSIMIVGPLLARYGKGYIPRPGGDKIGRRRLDTHFIGFEKLGAKFIYDNKEEFYRVTTKGLQGTNLHLEEASVTGTANIIMTAIMANGKTSIYNAACEPYIQQLCKMLNSMGAKITGIGSNLINIEGVKNLTGCTHKILPDMIEIGSFIGLAAITKSEITIKNVSYDNLGLIPSIFSKLGIKIERKGDDIFIPSQNNYKISNFIDGSILTISDAPWPGFTPDLLSIILVVAAQADGSVLIHQKMFESRLFFVDKLIDMGAQIILCDPHRATVIGLNHKFKFKATTMTSPDIRAGVSLLLAALAADGESTIHNVEQIDRGYQNIDKRLNAIGAKITRIN
jgi:UDP-N-acetylglucosamine 1-carboxyvinyltransferase|tara:strand:- start:1219 stop:2526 length:1308 start_codon:yes stop_codon:yes gene_type:complete